MRRRTALCRCNHRAESTVRILMQTAEQTAEGKAGDAASSFVGPAFTIVGPDGKPITLTAPTTIEQMQALQARREALSDQLSNAADRRAQIASEISTTQPGPARTGLEERLKVLDQRIVQLETDLATTGQQLANAPAIWRGSPRSRSARRAAAMISRRDWSLEALASPSHGSSCSDSGGGDANAAVRHPRKK